MAVDTASWIDEIPVRSLGDGQQSKPWMRLAHRGLNGIEVHALERHIRLVVEGGSGHHYSRVPTNRERVWEQF